MEAKKRFEAVFVIGAGASKAYGMPVGSELGERIIELIDRSMLKKALIDMDLLQSSQINEFRHALLGAGSDTIDDFLAERKDLSEVGRFFTAFEIFSHELTVLRNNQHWPIREIDWIKRLLQYSVYTDLDSFRNSRFGFVTFNYDRVLEIKLGRCLSSRFRLSPEDTCKLVSDFPIAHVHGSLGQLLPEELSQNQPNIEFNELLYKEVLRRSSGIGFVHDVESSGERMAKDFLANTERVYFLGFGYGQSNLSRIGAESLRPRAAIGTAVGIKSADLRRLQTLFPGVHLVGTEETSCCELIDAVLTGDAVLEAEKSRKSTILLNHIKEETRKHSPHATVMFEEGELFSYGTEFGIQEREISEMLKFMESEGVLRQNGISTYSLA